MAHELPLRGGYVVDDSLGDSLGDLPEGLICDDDNVAWAAESIVCLGAKGSRQCIARIGVPTCFKITQS